MGQALVRGWLAKGHDARAIHVSIRSRARARRPRGWVVAASVALPERSEAFAVVVLAVKPNQLAAVLPQCGTLARRNECVVLSIAAGKTIDGIAARARTKRGHRARDAEHARRDRRRA